MIHLGGFDFKMHHGEIGECSPREVADVLLGIRESAHALVPVFERQLVFNQLPYLLFWQ